jgi:hypothetical protein
MSVTPDLLREKLDEMRKKQTKLGTATLGTATLGTATLGTATIGTAALEVPSLPLSASSNHEQSFAKSSRYQQTNVQSLGKSHVQSHIENLEKRLNERHLKKKIEDLQISTECLYPSSLQQISKVETLDGRSGGSSGAFERPHVSLCEKSLDKESIDIQLDEILIDLNLLYSKSQIKSEVSSNSREATEKQNFSSANGNIDKKLDDIRLILSLLNSLDSKSTGSVDSIVPYSKLKSNTDLEEIQLDESHKHLSIVKSKEEEDYPKQPSVNNSNHVGLSMCLCFSLSSLCFISKNNSYDCCCCISYQRINDSINESYQNCCNRIRSRKCDFNCDCCFGYRSNTNCFIYNNSSRPNECSICQDCNCFYQCFNSLFSGCNSCCSNCGECCSNCGECCANCCANCGECCAGLG